MTNDAATLPRRRLLALGAGTLGLLVVRTAPAQQPEELTAAIAGWTGGAAVQAGKVKLEIEKIVDNGNAKYSTPHLPFEIHPSGGAAVNPYPTVRAHC